MKSALLVLPFTVHTAWCTETKRGGEARAPGQFATPGVRPPPASRHMPCTTRRMEIDRSAERALGAEPTATGVRFALYTTKASRAGVRIFDGDAHGDHELEQTAPGRFEGEVTGAKPGNLYNLLVDGKELPDPYARFLPQGVNGPARVEPKSAPRPLAFLAPPFARWVLYELHIGAFTPEGTYRAAVEKLPGLVELGVNAIEIMPIAAFAGKRGWGYDGVALYAPFAPYGEPEDLRALVEAAHGLGIAVMLDVVYNHFGPAGNHLPDYAAEYFSETKNAWGHAPNYAEPHMRRLVLDNARYWLEEFGFDGLRLDATHGILDDSEPHILAELAELAHAMDPPRVLVAEDERNDPLLVERYGLDGQWADDFHHVVRVTATGEHDGYYKAYEGGAAELARVISRGWLYEGQIYPPSGEPRGKPATLRHDQLVYCIQNHDQVGNRALGTRITDDVSRDVYRAQAVLLFFLPPVPMLFMGQEWGATSPFLFFTDHEESLGKAITEGRRKEFDGFAAFQSPELQARIPDPQAAATFMKSKLDWSERERGHHAELVLLYRELAKLRAKDPVLSGAGQTTATAEGGTLVVTRESPAGKRILLFNPSAAPRPEPRLYATELYEVLVSSVLLPFGILPAGTAAVVGLRR